MGAGVQFLPCYKGTSLGTTAVGQTKKARRGRGRTVSGVVVPRKTSAENIPLLGDDLGSPGCSLVETASRMSEDVTSL